MGHTKLNQNRDPNDTYMPRGGLSYGVCCTVIIAGLLIGASSANAQSANAQSALDPAKPALTLCQGSYALCAASTCERTGNTFPGKPFPEVVCKCPVLPGPALADVTGGDMHGTCDPPVDPVTKKVGVWSLFWPHLNIPQEVNGIWRRDVAALPHNCPTTTGTSSEPVLYGQCFSYACKNVRRINGILVADCYCPAEHVLDPNKHEFAVQAGRCKSSVCTKIPVGGPFVVMGKFCKNEK